MLLLRDTTFSDIGASSYGALLVGWDPDAYALTLIAALATDLFPSPIPGSGGATAAAYTLGSAPTNAAQCQAATTARPAAVGSSGNGCSVAGGSIDMVLDASSVCRGVPANTQATLYAVVVVGAAATPVSCGRGVALLPD